MGMLGITAHILDHFWRLRSFRNWDNGMDTNPNDGTSYTTQYQEAVLKYVGIEYCAKLWRFPVIKPKNFPSTTLLFSAVGPGSGQSSFEPHD